ncbi:MAG: hypothetical protein PHH54_00005 [Candidatus Nanoarchaeia archaeon]|nr:hypothetical protein [Candidatus Nanoarchaeia archaeon]MDD5740345.1 hypothetical protein [Candidatus Nanoarchaeia archaeon]
MKFWRAVLCGALIWILVFFEVCILMFGFKLTSSDTVYYIIHYIAFAVFVILASLIYFRGKKVKAGVLNGLYLWIIFIIAGIVLDSIITIPLFMNFNYSFLITREMLIGDVLSLIICLVVGALKK